MWGSEVLRVTRPWSVLMVKRRRISELRAHKKIRQSRLPSDRILHQRTQVKFRNLLQQQIYYTKPTELGIVLS